MGILLIRNKGVNRGAPCGCSLQRTNHFTAQALGFHDIKQEGNTETAAIDQVRQSLAAWLGTGKLVSINIPLHGTGNSWLDSFGHRLPTRSLRHTMRN